MDWHARSVAEVAAHFQTDPTTGLTDEQVEARQLGADPVQLQLTEVLRWPTVLARQFANGLILVLLVAAALALMVGEAIDSVTILAIVLLNGVLGFVQEWRAERALRALRQLLSPRCRVVRAGVESDLDVVELVPGDLVVLAAGYRVPADVRLSSCVNLEVDEAALTGESLAVAKQFTPVAADAVLAARASMAWMGTAVTNGHGHGIVAASGRGRVRAYAAALAMWVLLVFAVDAVLLTVVVALAPPAPEQIGQHGHDELAGSGGTRGTGDSSGEASGSLSAWLMLLDPVDLFRLSALQAGPRLRAQWAATGLGADGYVPWLRLLAGWTIWAVIPVSFGIRRFRRAALA